MTNNNDNIYEPKSLRTQKLNPKSELSPKTWERLAKFNKTYKANFVKRDTPKKSRNMGCFFLKTRV